MALRKSKKEQVCRMCLREDDLTPIFANVEQSDKYTVALFLTTGLQVELNDGLPQAMCGECREFVHACIQFREQGHAVEQTLFRWGYSKHISNSGFEEKFQEFYALMAERLGKPGEVEEDSKADIINQLPEYTEENFDGEPPDDSDNDATYEPPPEKFEREDKGPIKKRGRKSKDEMEKEQKYNEKKSPAQIAKDKGLLYRQQKYGYLVDEPLDGPGPFTCKLCLKLLKNWEVLRQHARIHWSKVKVMCELCGKNFNRRQNLLRHYTVAHGTERKYPCQYCSYAAFEARRLDIHIRTKHTGETPFACDICGAAFFSRRGITYHMNKHPEVEERFACQFCPETFKLKRSMQTHQKQAHYKKSIPCRLCLKLVRMPYMPQHMARVHGEGEVKGSKKANNTNNTSARIAPELRRDVPNVEESFGNSAQIEVMPKVDCELAELSV